MKKITISVITTLVIAFLPYFIFYYNQAPVDNPIMEVGVNSATFPDVEKEENRKSSDHPSMFVSAQVQTTTLQEQENTEELSHDVIVSITDKFMDTLVQEVDDHYKVLLFHTKSELIEAFSSIASKEVASKYIDIYYQEKENGLYIIATETPPWFEKNRIYEKIKLGDNRVKVTQSNQNEIFGEYNIDLEFTYSNEWKLTNITTIKY
ncbi:hypothetical protein [Aquibacillus kalidii]|uniref:hypothetical protein n=1 Tax=Aquibacillus kalidii TaxID=2762597 RepID=UPI001647CD19|nr:hypothetical protein [Aquibacillus kalidii]